MISATIFSLGLLGLTNAQSVVNLFLPDTDQQPLIASVIASDAAATTYLLTCPPGTDSSDCGYGAPVTIVEGPTTFALSTTEAGLFTYSVGCSLAGTTAAVCSDSADGSEANFPGVTTSTLAASDITFFPVTLTDSIATYDTSFSFAAASTTGSGEFAFATESAVSATGSASEVLASVSSSLRSGSATSGNTSGSASRSVTSGSSTGGSVTSTHIGSITSVTGTASRSSSSGGASGSASPATVGTNGAIGKIGGSVHLLAGVALVIVGVLASML